MALAAEVTGRHSTKRITQLTNPDDQTATTVNATILGYAVTDAEADFLTYAGVEYDNSVAKHVSIGVFGVLAYLRSRMNAAGADADKAISQFQDMLRQLKLTTGNNRITPTSNSRLYPSPVNPENQSNYRPPFDDEDFDRYAPDAPIK